MMNNNDVTKLAEKAKQGSKTAFEKLYKEFYPKVYYFVKQNVSAAELAALSEPVFLPDDYAVNTQTKQQLQGVIDSLPPDMRSVIILYYYDDLSLAEVAKVIGTNKNNAAQKLNTARKKLRSKIEKLIGKGSLFSAVPPSAVLANLENAGLLSGAALLLNLITYINELNSSGESISMPGLLIPVSPGSVPVTDEEKKALHRLAKTDIMIPEDYMYIAREIMQYGRDIPEKYLATAHGDFTNAPMTHFYYGSAEALYAFAPSYARSFRKAGAQCVIHVGKDMHHCYALQYCKPAFEEIMKLIRSYYIELIQDEKSRKKSK
jgi:DNA-directed RNA polymerase specialized sigma24 family protein